MVTGVTDPAQSSSRVGTVTVLFTDLVGSSELRARLGEEATEAVRRSHDALLAQAVREHQGRLVKGLGDGIMATFASAADAVGAAVAIQQAVEASNRRVSGNAVAVRIGISAGDVTWERGDCHGTPVVEASRLCAGAEGGQILASDLVRGLARGRGAHLFRAVGALALKGLPEPVGACEVAWEPLLGRWEGPGEIPLPPRLATQPQLGLFGRAAEQEALSLAWAKAKDGQRQVVLVAGEPGIGKTRLASEVARAAKAEGATVLLGTCDEDLGLPYLPFVEALRHYIAHAPEDVLTAHVRVHKGELGRLVPDLARRVPDLPPPQVAEAETERYLMFEAATGLLAAASQERPVVLLLDDLQWASLPELILLKHVVRSALPMRLLVIATYRDSELSRTHPLTATLADLRREFGVERLALRGLDDEAVVALIAAAAGHDLNEAGIALAHAIQQEAEGSPFFVTEILRHLSESGAVFQEGGRWRYRGDVAGLGIPESVREVIGRRLGRFSEATSRILGLAAVIGRQFDLALLARVAEASEDAVLDALEEATTAALITEVAGSTGRFAFTHALIRATLYDELSATRRARLHRRVGEALEEMTGPTPGARIDELAHHWLAATQVADATRAVGYARRAGEQALACLAYEEAAVQFERALAVLEPRDRAGELQRCDLLLALGDAQRRAADTRYRETMVAAAQLARRVGDAERLGRAALGCARPGGFYSSKNVDEELVALYEEANAALDTGDNMLRARILGQLAVELLYTPQRDRRLALSREALDIARRLDDRAGLARVLMAYLIANNDPTTLGERLALNRELEGLAEALDDLELHLFAANSQATALLESGDATRAERAVTRLERLATDLRQPFYLWWAHLGRAMLSVMRGEADAEEKALAALETGLAAGQPDAAAAFGAQLFNLRHSLGRLDELTDTVRASVDEMPGTPAWRTALALLYCETDRPAEAREQLAVLAASGFDVPLDWSWASAMADLAEVCGELRDPDLAAVVHARLRPVAAQVMVLSGLLTCQGSLALPLAIAATRLGRWDEAAEYFEQALAMNDRMGARPYVVRTRRAYAAMLLERNAPGDAARAAELVVAALAEAERLGMAREASRLRGLEAACTNR
jgi:class 3 adenylate cyclase/tetratricopeptide (TPR) repeat protein